MSPSPASTLPNPIETPAPRPCQWCKGTGTVDLLDTPEPCYACDGQGLLDPPEWDTLLRLIVIVTKRGARLRASRPRTDSTVHGRRAYFLWRLARFHGGQDVTMPMVAEMEIEGDPFEPELNRAAETLARFFFGTDLGAASRWAPLLGLPMPVTTDRLPVTAREDGPVCLDGKPIAEWLETA